MKRALFALLLLTACQSAPERAPAPSSDPVIAPTPRVVAAVPVPVRLPPAPGALPLNQFRDERGRVLTGRVTWQGMGRSVLGVINGADGETRGPASVLIAGRRPIEVPLWRDQDVTNVVLEVDGTAYVNLPCQAGRGGPRRVCPYLADDRGEANRLIAAMRAGSVLRLVFLRGDVATGELSLSLAGFRERAARVGV